MVVRFARVRGRIIPIFKDAASKGSGIFGRKAKRQLHEDRMKAIQAVRSALSGNAKTMESGLETRFVYKVKNKIVKEMTRKKGQTRSIDRIAAESALFRKGFAPKTFLVRTSRDDFFVQDDVGKMALNSLRFKKPLDMNNFSKITYKRKSHLDKIKGISSRLKEQIKKATGLEMEDLHGRNFGFKDKKPMVVDAGHVSFPDDQGYFTKSWNEKTMRNLSKRYIISNKD